MPGTVKHLRIVISWMDLISRGEFKLFKSLYARRLSAIYTEYYTSVHGGADNGARVIIRHQLISTDSL